MSQYLKIIGLIPFLTGFVSCKYCSETYTVFFPNVPQLITPGKNSVSTVYYILKQTHEPLFRKDDGENYTSRILKKWSRNITSTEFTMCPNTKLKFNSKSFFTADYFHKYITEITYRFTKDFNVKKTKDGCFKIRFKKPQRNYLNFLTYYENAPSIKTIKNFECGLGKFYIEKITPKEIVLKRKAKTKNGYNIIHGVKYNKENAYNGDRDFNLIASFNIPSWIKKEYQKYESVELRVVVLIINHPNKRVRKRIYNCMNIEKLRESFYPGSTNFVNIKNILPLGVNLSEHGLPVQNCHRKKSFFRENLIFANWRSDNRNRLATFIYNFNKKAGVKVKIKDFKPEELVKNFDEEKKKFNLTIIVVDATKNDPLSFFEPFFYTRRFYDPILFDENKRAENEKQNIKPAELLSILDKEFLALPLYQSLRTLYYPPHIKNIIVGRDFLQYPEIAEFRW